MPQMWTKSSGILLSSLIPATLSQTVTTDIEACAVLDCSLTTYILIGITAFYSLLSLICIILICVACACREKRSSSKVGPQHTDNEKELDEVFLNPGSPLEPIEEATTENFFENEHATSDDSDFDSKPDNESSSNSDGTDSDESEKDTSLVIKNPSAKKQARLLKKQSPKSPMSLLQDYQPKGSPIPPRKVPVPFSEPDGEGKLLEQSPYPPGHGPVRLPPIQKKQGTPRQRRKAAAEAIMTPLGGSKTNSPRLSPFSSKKNPQNEIAQNTGIGTPTIKRMEKLGSPLESPGNQQKSTTPLIDENTLKFEMVKVSHKWRQIGKAFTIPTSVLNNISIICSNEKDTCMLLVCEEWLRMHKERDWSELIEILQSEDIDEKKLADYLQMYYYKANSGQSQSNELSRKTSEGNLSFYFKREGYRSSQKETKPVENENDVEGSTTWL